MRVLRILAIPLLSFVALLAFTVPSAAATGKYVALGDSYSSGLGAGSYSGGSCKRSANAYAQLWANSHAPSAFSFVAEKLDTSWNASTSGQPRATTKSRTRAARSARRQATESAGQKSPWRTFRLAIVTSSSRHFAGAGAPSAR